MIGMLVLKGFRWGDELFFCRNSMNSGIVTRIVLSQQQRLSMARKWLNGFRWGKFTRFYAFTFGGEAFLCQQARLTRLQHPWNHRLPLELLPIDHFLNDIPRCSLEIAKNRPRVAVKAISIPIWLSSRSLHCAQSATIIFVQCKLLKAGFPSSLCCTVQHFSCIFYTKTDTLHTSTERPHILQFVVKCLVDARSFSLHMWTSAFQTESDA